MTNDFGDLCMACRVGDLQSVDKLLSIGVDPNQTDKYDNTPLFLGSLCGHYEVVKLLLERGAVCDVDKLEGARCVYGALTDKIRNLLIEYDISKAVDTNLPFASHIRSLRDSTDFGIVTEDLILKCVHNDRTWKVHRFLLGIRNQYYFGDILKQIDGREDVLELEIDEDVMQNLIDNLYLVTHDPYKFEKLNKKELLKSVKRYGFKEYTNGLQQYIKTIDPRDKAKVINQLQITFSKQARIDFQNLVEQVIIPNRIITETSELTKHQISTLQKSSNYPDVILSIFDEDTEKHIHYPLNRAILIRDDYFKTMFSSSFQEAHDYELIPKYDILNTSKPIPTINLPVVSEEIVEIVIRFLYYDNTDIPLNLAIDTIFLADLLLNDRLKTMAAVSITSDKDFTPTNEELFEILTTGWQTRIDRLEKFVAKIIAFDLDRFLIDDKFKSIVIESSQRISDRQEFDSIELIDDIRFFLQKKWKIDFDGLFEGEENDLVEFQPGFQSYQDDLNKIEAFLFDLDLEA